jgi:hypothetical protein
MLSFDSQVTNINPTISNFDWGPYTEQIDHFIKRLKLNYPFHSPYYAGQMLKPPHPISWLGYSLAMLVNANNHALDGGPETSLMEKEVMEEFKQFFSFPRGE